MRASTSVRNWNEEKNLNWVFENYGGLNVSGFSSLVISHLQNEQPVFLISSDFSSLKWIACKDVATKV